jgi:Flp pilus assembly protein TadD
MGQLAPALATLQKLAVGENPPAPAARDALSLINGTAQNAAQRTSLAESRLKADPKDLLALVARAEIHEQQGQFKEAVSRFEKAVEVSPDFWPARRRLAYLYAERLNDDKSALPHATKVRQVMPEDAVSAHVLGKIAFRRNDFANALRYFQEVARNSSASGEPHYLVGLTSLRLTRTNDSKAALAKALELPLSPQMSNDAKRLLGELR